MTETTPQNVISEVVENDLCIGCGMCAAVCPKANLTVALDRTGQYRPSAQADTCPRGCRVCLSVCPFSPSQEDEDTLGREEFGTVAGMKHTPETGYYLDAVVGYPTRDGHRERGASGGATSWLLETLLRENRIDYAICVAPTDDPERRFQFNVCHTAEEIRAGAGSCYHPVEMSGVIQHILAHEGRCALVALPCFGKAIRLAMKQRPALRDRIKFVLGLTCGQTKSAFFAEYVCALGGGAPGALKKMRFRVKAPGRPASDFGMHFVCDDTCTGATEGTVHWTEGIGRIWGQRYFTPRACDFCDDVFAELADACFMDAWLPGYTRDWRGHSIILLRQAELQEMVRAAAANGSATFQSLPIAAVTASQRSVLRSKRGEIRQRIVLAGREGRLVPTKRLSKCNVKLSLVRKRLVHLQSEASRKSCREWVDAGKDLAKFVERMAPLQRRLQRVQRLWKLWRAPGAVLRRLRSPGTPRRTPS